MFLVIFGLLLLVSPFAYAQNNTVQWLDFEALDDSLQRKAKAVFLYFQTDWCSYCRKMDKRVFSKKEIAEVLNEQFYPVRMDAESNDTIYFEGQAFINREASYNRKGIHEIAKIFSRKEVGFVAPTIIVLDKDFRVKQQHYEYLHAEQLSKILNKEQN